jgi:hypothetical protein
MLFGAISAPGEIVVKVRSPDQPIALEKKERLGPFWLSRGKYDITGIPGLYFLLASTPIDDILPAAVRETNGLDLSDGVMDMQLEPRPDGGDTRLMLMDAVLRRKQARHEYIVESGAVEIFRGRLFSTVIDLPPQLPLGVYQVDVFLVRAAEVIATGHHQIDALWLT